MINQILKNKLDTKNFKIFHPTEKFFTQIEVLIILKIIMLVYFEITDPIQDIKIDYIILPRKSKKSNQQYRFLL